MRISPTLMIRQYHDLNEICVDWTLHNISLLSDSSKDRDYIIITIIIMIYTHTLSIIIIIIINAVLTLYPSLIPLSPIVTSMNSSITVITIIINPFIIHHQHRYQCDYYFDGKDETYNGEDLVNKNTSQP
jgi:hypothetical protein